MPLLNYTTKVPVIKTLAEIQAILVKAGATAVLNEYQDGYIIALSFKVVVNGQEIAFKLPSEWQPIMSILERQRVPRSLQTQEQALRVSWRIVKDWVEAQMAIIETKMATVDQVFLPYAVMRGGKTLYQKIVDDGLLLTGGENETN